MSTAGASPRARRWDHVVEVPGLVLEPLGHSSDSSAGDGDLLAPAPDAAAVDCELCGIERWRHGYATGLAQAEDLVRRLAAGDEPPREALEHALRTLRGWLTDAR